MPWLLNCLYLLLLAVLSPVLLYRALRRGKYREGWSEKLLGRLPQLDPVKDRIWLHAVSVGEVLLLKGLIRELRSQFPEASFVLTTTTVTGHEVARAQYADLLVCYCPLDFSWAVRNAIRRLKPTALVFAELELWPNLIWAGSNAGIRMAIVNGRLSEKSFRGYSKVLPLIRNLLSRFDAIAVQSDEYARRFLALGTPPGKLFVTGSVKYDGVQMDRHNPRTEDLRRTFGVGDNDVVFIAGSTQHPEELYALDTWHSLRKDYPELRLIIVPRHKERFDDVARLIEQLGHPVLRRSTTLTESFRSIESDRQRSLPVILLDTLGELGSCWGLADVAFVGGSLTNRGGQNMIEPAAYGAAVVFGPNTWNFREAVTLLHSAAAAIVVQDSQQFQDTIRKLIEHPDTRREMGLKAQAAVMLHGGATTKTIDRLRESGIFSAVPGKNQRAA